MDTKKSVDTLQLFITGLSKGAFLHLVQGKYFESMGLAKMGTKYIEHYEEEMGWVKKFMTRILDLGGDIKIENCNGQDIIKDPIKYLKTDLALQSEGLSVIYKYMDNLKDDPTTYEIFKDYLADEEEDFYWSQGQINLIEMIGKENWLTSQI